MLIFLEISLLFLFYKKMMDPNQSVLSKLPNNVIDEILIRLPFRDAVCTSILSKEWRKHWCRLPQLTLDSDFWKSKKDLTGDKRATSNFTMTIHNIITRHSGPLTKFTLCIQYWEIYPLLTTYYISSLETESNTLFLNFRDNSNCHLHFSHVCI